MRLWRTATRELAEQLAAEGRGLVFLRQTPDGPWDLIALGPELTCPGQRVDLLPLRKFLWDNRQARRNGRGNAVLWAWYDVDARETKVGLGAFVSPAIAQRFARMHPKAETSLET